VTQPPFYSCYLSVLIKYNHDPYSSFPSTADSVAGRRDLRRDRVLPSSSSPSDESGWSSWYGSGISFVTLENVSRWFSFQVSNE